MRVATWGNSLAIRVPKSVAEAGNLKAGTRVICRNVDNGGILIVPVDGAIAVSVTQILATTAIAAEEW